MADWYYAGVLWFTSNFYGFPPRKMKFSASTLQLFSFFFFFFRRLNDRTKLLTLHVCWPWALSMHLLHTEFRGSRLDHRDGISTDFLFFFFFSLIQQVWMFSLLYRFSERATFHGTEAALIKQKNMYIFFYSIVHSNAIFENYCAIPQIRWVLQNVN